MKPPWHKSSQSTLTAGRQDVSPARPEVSTPGDQLLTRPESFTTSSQWWSELWHPRRRPLTGKDLGDNTVAWIKGSAQSQAQENLGSLLVYASHLFQEGGIAAHASTPSFYTVSQGRWFESNPRNLICFLVINPVWKTSTLEISNVRSRG